MASAQFIPTTVDTTVLSTTLADYQKTLADNVYDDNVMLRLASQAGNKRVIVGGGSIVDILLKTKQDDGGFYLGADPLQNTQGDNTTQVENRWQNAYEPIQITRDEERQNSGSAHKLLDLVATKTEISRKAISDRMEEALSVPVGAANNLNDIDTIVNTGNLGTINGGTQTFWQSTVTTSGAFATQGLTDMTTLFYGISGSSMSENPTVVLTTKSIFQKYEQTRLPLERISNGDMSANAGFKNLTFKGVPVVYGNYIGAGKLYELNMNFIRWNVDSMTDFTTTPFVTPTNQTVKVAFILVRGNMTTNNRRRQGKLQSIT